MKKPHTPWYDARLAATLLAVVALALGLAIAFRSLDTGSWQQYGMAFALLVFAGNRTVRAIRGPRRGTA